MRVYGGFSDFKLDRLECTLYWKFLPALRELRGRPPGRWEPFFPSITEWRCIFKHHSDQPLTFCSDCTDFSSTIQADDFCFTEFILILPLPGRSIATDDNIQYLVHGVETDLGAAQGFLQVNIPATHCLCTSIPHGFN